MATPNYGYEKRQKELAKKRKKEDKLKNKAERKAAGLPEEDGTDTSDDSEQTDNSASNSDRGAV